VKQFTLAILLMLPLAAVPREKYNSRPLSEIAVAALDGKRLAVSRHELRELPILPLKQQGAEWHALRRIKVDPSDLFERELAPAIAKQFGMELQDGQADADYLLDILVTDRRHFNTPDLKAAFYLKEKKFWSGFGVRVQLEYRETDRPVFVGNCYSDTLEHPALTGETELAADDARLFKDTFDSLAWRCLHRIAQQLALADDALPATPPELVDPLAAYAAAHPRP
jgi:hypothetical protein